MLEHPTSATVWTRNYGPGEATTWLEPVTDEPYAAAVADVE